MKKSYLMAVIVASAMISSVFFYGLVAHLSAAHIRPSEEGQAVMRSIFYALAIVSLNASPFLSGFILKKSMPAGKLSRTELTPQAITLLAGRRMAAMAGSLALAEASALYGLVLFFMTGNLKDFYLPAILAVTALVLQFPRYEQWLGWIETNVEP